MIAAGEEAAPAIREVYVALRIDGGKQCTELLIAPKAARLSSKRQSSPEFLPLTGQ